MNSVQTSSGISEGLKKCQLILLLENNLQFEFLLGFENAS